jgi:hypothetical protein
MNRSLCESKRIEIYMTVISIKYFNFSVITVVKVIVMCNHDKFDPDVRLDVGLEMEIKTVDDDNDKCLMIV